MTDKMSRDIWLHKDMNVFTQNDDDFADTHYILHSEHEKVLAENEQLRDHQKRLERRIGNQRRAWRDTWEIIEARTKCRQRWANYYPVKLREQAETIARYEAALRWVYDYVHQYCIIVHPEKNTKGVEPEKAIKNKIKQALGESDE